MNEISNDTGKTLRELWGNEDYENLIKNIQCMEVSSLFHPRIAHLYTESLIKLKLYKTIYDHVVDNPELLAKTRKYLLPQANEASKSWIYGFSRAYMELALDSKASEIGANILANVNAVNQISPGRSRIVEGAISHAKRLLKEKQVASKWDQKEVKHIAIIGLSYCGSTILGGILGSLENVYNIGESFWLNHRKVKDNPLVADYNSLEDGILHCASCGPQCQYLTSEFRHSLSLDPRLWYLKIAEQFNAKTLVSSDKNRIKLLANDPLLRFDAIVLFKSPEQHWFSNAKKATNKTEGFNPITSIDRFIQRWSDEYELFLNTLNPNGKTLFLCFDEFCRNPQLHFEKLCNYLNLKVDLRVLEEIRRNQHFIGGNALVGKSYLSNTAPLKLQPLPAPQISRSEHAKLLESNKVQQIWQACMQRYREDFNIT